MNDLRTLFKDAAAEPPPPTAIPSQAVFARVRKVRRRRAAGAAVLATATVAAVVAIAGNFTNTNSQPPVLGPPTLPIGAVSIEMAPSVTGRTGKVAVTMRGTVRVPLSAGAYVPTDGSFVNLSGGFTANWGQGEPDGGDAGMIDCAGSTKEFTGAATYHLDPHAYPRRGTYTVEFAVRFCGPNGDWVTSRKSVNLVVE